MDPVVILATDSIAVGPGEQARLPVRIRNQSRRVESYKVDVVGEAAGFSRVEPATVSVLPGREAEVSVLFTPPGGATVPSGMVPFAVRATSEVEASYSAVAEGHLELAGVTGMQMWASNNAASGRWSGRYELQFANQGNAATRYAVSGRDPSAALRVSVEQELIDLRPGARATTEVKAKARHPFLRGSPVNRMIEVQCRKVTFGALAPEPGGAPDPTDPDQRTLQLSFQQKPVLSKLMLAGIVLAAALLLAFVVLSLRQTEKLELDLTAPDTPTGFSAQPSGSTAIFVSWDPVPNAVGYQIRRTTPDGEMGAEEAVVDAAARSHTIEDLDPGTQHCFALVAVGPDDAENSAPTTFECATTTAPSALEPPGEFTATPQGAGVFVLSWTYPETEGVKFDVLVDSSPTKEAVGLETSIVLEQRPAEYTAVLSVQAVRGEETSDPAASQTVTVEALPVDSTTTTGAGQTTVPGATVVVPPPPPPTGSGGGTTTTSPPTTTTTISFPASDVLQDIELTPAAWLGPYTPESAGGVPVDERRNALALTFGVPVGEIGLFSNRDTRVSDAVDTTGDLTNVSPTQSFFYVARPTSAEATALCDSQPTRTCGTLTLQGAASAADGTPVAVVGRLDAATATVDDVDEAITDLRSDLATQAVFAIDGGRLEGFAAGEIVLYVSGFGSEAEADRFCAPRPAGSCITATLTVRP